MEVFYGLYERIKTALKRAVEGDRQRSEKRGVGGMGIFSKNEIQKREWDCARKTQSHGYEQFEKGLYFIPSVRTGVGGPLQHNTAFHALFYNLYFSNPCSC